MSSLRHGDRGGAVTEIRAALAALGMIDNPDEDLTTGRHVAVDVFDNDLDHAVRAFQQHRGLLVDFWATWCGPCKMVAPVLEEIANDKVGALKVAKIDVDANPATARDFQVVSIPTMILFKDGAPVKRIVGAKGKAALLRELADVV